MLVSMPPQSPGSAMARGAPAGLGVLCSKAAQLRSDATFIG